MRPLQKRVVIELHDGNYLLVNPYSGAADIIDAEALHLLESPDTEDENVAALKRRGHLVEETEETDLFRSMEMYSKTLHKNLSEQHLHVIMPTYECNLRCAYCFEKHLYRKTLKSKATMDEKTVDTLFEVIQSLDEESKGEKCVVLYGGEPLLLKNLPLIEYILKKGNDCGYSFKVVTNGSELYHFAPLLAEVTVLKIQVTLDGLRNVHDKRRYRKGGIGTFDDIVKGIDAALEYELPLGIRINVDSENINHLPEFAQFYQEKWYPAVYAFVTNVCASECVHYSSLISAEEFTKELIELFVEDERMEVFLQTFRYPNVLLEHLFTGKPFKPRFWACGAHTSIFIYDPVGDIYPCYQAVGDHVNKIGVYTPELKFNDTFHQWRNRSVFTIKECRECNIAFFCGGGCAYGGYTTTGSIYSPYCDKIKFSVKYEVPYLYYLLKTKKISLSEARDWY